MGANIFSPINIFRTPRVFPAGGSFAKGTVAAPSINFIGDTTTGFSDFAPHDIAFSSNGVAIFASGTTYFSLKSTTIFGWASGDPTATGFDVTLTRGAANELVTQSNFVPDVDVIRSLGKSGKQWLSIFVTAINTDNTNLILSPGTADIRWNKALVALGGGAAPTLGTIGGAGPTAAAQNSWMRVLDNTGAAFWVPAWK